MNLNSQELYKQQYLKYKLKYINLKKNLVGGGEKTAETYFYSNLKKRYTDIRKIFLEDHIINTTDSVLPLPSVDDFKDLDQSQISLNFEYIFNEIKTKTNDPNIIDFVCKIYLNGNLGNPNSLENIGRLKDNIVKLNLLINNKKK
jgi:hypothetical protein